jgi:iron complex transport system substrate-binding protein
MDIERLASICVDKGFRLHRDLAPGLLESVSETMLFESLRRDGIEAVRQLLVTITHDGIVVENAFRFDLLVESKLLIEIKSTERHAPVHAKQLLTYLRLMKLPLGLLMNFGMATFKDGIRRLANNHGGAGK